MNTKQNSGLFSAPISRRDAVRCAVLGAAGLMMANKFVPKTQAAVRPAKAKSVIQVWMWGGPPHLDTFDPKPEAGNDYCGPLTNPIATNVSGVRICELLPLLAKQADKYSLIRSMTHGVNGHETAAYEVQTGRKPGNGQVFPGVGAVVSLFKGYSAGYKGLLPPYIVLTQLQGRFSEAGFLGSRCKPFATGGDPSSSKFVVEGVVAQGITEQRQHDRRELLHNLNTLDSALPGDQRLAAMAQCEKEAYDLILGDAGKVFDLSQEKPELRERYGQTHFGQACLMARRLVEKGVPYVTINYQGWDLHKGLFTTMRRKGPELDKGLATLLQDLSDRGLLDSTIIWCGGEFGRSPRVQWDAPWNGGRNHYGKVFSYLVAGGGFKGGRVVGSSTEKGEEPKERPVYPTDLIGSIYDLLGIDGNAKLPHPQGLAFTAMPPTSERRGIGGHLTEIM
jgi:uncharacterized protein (DUF1501 family)